jgi:outer membrane receptor protein involved in Fe transport
MYLRFVIGIVWVVVVAASALAQTGAVTGTAKDQSGAVLPGVSISVTNTGTNAARAGLTDERGDYTVRLLPVGMYKITAELPGFRTGVAENIKVDVNDNIRIDFSLQVGNVTEQLVVTEASPLVQSETSSVGKVIDGQKIAELPLNGRHFESLINMVPGVTASGQERNVPGVGVASAGGARTTFNNFVLDGIDNNDPSVNDFTLRPIVDAIQEFKVQTNSYTAEYGRGGGANIQVTTKGGTNEFHGSIWEFLRNDALDARNFFAPANAPKPPFHRNQFGGVFGGPIAIPHLYDGHDKTFFFFAYEGVRRQQIVSSLQAVPSLAFRQGDFSSLAAQLKDPLTNGTFAGNIIPANRFNAVSQQVVTRFYPVPTPGLAGTNNLQVNNQFPETIDQFNARLDRRISNSNSLFGRWGFTRDILETPCSGNGTSTCVPGFGNHDTLHAESLSIVDTHILSNRLINEVRLGFNRQGQPRVQLRAFKEDVTSELGIPTSPNPRDWGVPSFVVTGYGNIGDRGFQTRAGNTYQLVDTVSYSPTSHSIRMGFDMRKVEFNAASQARETFRFDGRFSGNAFADFLLGFPNQTTRDPTDTMRYHRVWTYAGFVQDDYKATSKLTVNMGLRYEYYTPDVEKYNRLAQLDITTFQYVIAGVNGASRSLYQSKKTNFAPRIGFAFRPTASSDLAVRAGYGIFYNQAILGNNLFFQRTGPPFQKPEQFNATTNATDLTLSTPFPSALQASTAIFNAPSIDPHFKDANVQQWNLGVEKSCAQNMVFELGYIGSKGTNLTRVADINQAFLTPANLPVQSRRPLPQYGTVTVLQGSANSFYHGMVARAERRFSGGVTFLTSYTFAHAIDDNDESNTAQDSRNLRANRGNSNFDIRHRMVFSYVWDIPFMKTNRFIGGWEFAGIQTFQTGRPLTATLSGARSNTGSTNDHPDATGIDPILRNSISKTVYLNPAAFSLQPTGTFGNSGRNTFYGPGQNNLDLTLSKNFKLETAAIQFRAEFFNAFNRPFLDNPNTQRDSAAFGTITATLRDNRQIQFGLKISY